MNRNISFSFLAIREMDWCCYWWLFTDDK